MAKIFCVANQKGGVGKTTTTVNLAAGLAFVGQRVLMVDLDPQGNATMSSGVDKREMELSVYDVLLEEASVAEARIRSNWGTDGVRAKIPTYDVLGANRDLAGAEVELVSLSAAKIDSSKPWPLWILSTTLCLLIARPRCPCSRSMVCVRRMASSCRCSANTLR
jgi:cellulose biosynthesis protein BcsQ